MNVQRHSCDIVVADDDEGDRYLIQKAIQDSGVLGDVQFFEDGQRLVDRLMRQLTEPSRGSKLPCLILVDLNMPRMDGRETLKIVKNHPGLKEIPVVVLTNSQNPEDIDGTYRNGANSFFTKPLNYSGLVDLMKLLKTYWLERVSLPQRVVS